MTYINCALKQVKFISTFELKWEKSSLPGEFKAIFLTEEFYFP